jgi:hypothetical protein
MTIKKTMSIFRQIHVRISEIALLLILILLPFSYKMTDIRQIIFLSILLSICVFIHMSKKIRSINYRIMGVIFALFFLFIFSMTEKVDIIRQIPLSTVFLAIVMSAFMIKIIVESKVKIINHPFTKYFLYACVFLFILMALFYPFFFRHYQMQPESNIHLFSNIVKYAMLFILVVNHLSDEKMFKIINSCFIFSLSVTIVLSILL